jgi:spore maturation protein CgeB
VPGIERFAVGHRHCAWYRSTPNAVDQVRHYLAAPDLRRQIADEGRAHALRHHTYEQRLQLLLAGRGYEMEDVASNDRIVPELEDPDASQPLNHL